MIRVSQYKRHGVATNGVEVDLRVELASGKVYRERIPCRVGGGKTAARTWAQEREREVLTLNRQGKDLAGIRRALRGEKEGQPDAPTLEVFWPRFLEGYCRANRQKGIRALEAKIGGGGVEAEVQASGNVSDSAQ